LKKKGKTKARVAVARKMLISIYYMLKNKEQYKFFGGNLQYKKSKYCLRPIISSGKPLSFACSYINTDLKNDWVA
jgi:hypothetical protein